MTGEPGTIDASLASSDGSLDPWVHDPQVLAWAGKHLPELRRSVSEQRTLRLSLIIGFLVGLVAHVSGFLLKSSVTTEPLALLADGSPFLAQGPGPFGSEFSPANPGQLFVSNAHGGAGAGTVPAFNDAADGTLSPIGSSPFADDQTAPCWVEITHDGHFLFTVNTGSGSVSGYSISSDGGVVDDLLRGWSKSVGHPADIAPDLEKLIGRPATTYAQWAAKNADAYR